MSFQFKSTQLINEFVHHFPEDKKNQVINYLVVLGYDIAKKLGQNNPKELYQTIKSLAKYIVNDYSEHGHSELREEIKKIQQQLVQLNSLFNEQEMNRSQENTRTKQQHNRFYTQNDIEEQQPENGNINQFKNTKRSFTNNKSPIHNVTAKITESPPPPIIHSMNQKNQVKPHLDDHQIKQLLYNGNSDDNQSLSNRENKNHSPRSIKYTINFENGKGNLSNRENIGQRFQTHETYKQQQNSSSKRNTSSRQKKKVPHYLQKVESKIKDKVNHDKKAFKYQQNFEDDDEQFTNNYRMSASQQMTANFTKQVKPSQESETYYEIQQYLQNQQNQKLDYSPVSEMKTLNQTKPVKSSLKHSNDQKKQKQQNYFEQHESLPFTHSINPIQVSDFQMSKQQSELSFDAFRKKAQQYTTPYAQSLQQSSFPIQTSSKPNEESSESFTNFTPPNKEVREFFQKQCIF